MTSLDKQIRDCFKRTLIQTEGDTELFDTDLTIDNIKALIANQVRGARIDELNRVPRISYSAEFAIHIEAYLDSRLAELQGDDK